VVADLAAARAGGAQLDDELRADRDHLIVDRIEGGPGAAAGGEAQRREGGGGDGGGGGSGVQAVHGWRPLPDRRTDTRVAGMPVPPSGRKGRATRKTGESGASPARWPGQ